MASQEAEFLPPLSPSKSPSLCGQLTVWVRSLVWPELYLNIQFLLVMGGTRFFHFGSIPSTSTESIDGTEYGSEYM